MVANYDTISHDLKVYTYDSKFSTSWLIVSYDDPFSACMGMA